VRYITSNIVVTRTRGWYILAARRPSSQMELFDHTQILLPVNVYSQWRLYLLLRFSILSLFWYFLYRPPW